MNRAAVDCGTNSTRLLIADENGNRICEELRLTRLGEGVHSSRSLLPAAIDRTCHALAEFKVLIEQHRVDSVRAVTTSAVRDASNSDEFLTAANRALGASIDVISGDQEAALTYAGATAKISNESWHLVVDIGGGSTEVVLGNGTEIVFAKSFDLGCVRLTEQFLLGDPPSEEQMASAAEAITNQVRASGLPELVRRYSPEMIAVAGTATSLAGIDIGLDRFDSDLVNGHVLSLAAVQKLHDDLRGRSAQERTSALLPVGRSEVILGGTIVLLTLMHMLGLSNCRTSTSDLLVGLLYLPIS